VFGEKSDPRKVIVGKEEKTEGISLTVSGAKSTEGKIISTARAFINAWKVARSDSRGASIKIPYPLRLEKSAELTGEKRCKL